MPRKRQSKDPKPATGGGRLHRLEEAIHDRFLAAEVAAEESAGYGSVTAAVEAVEAAVVPEHELGRADDAEEEGVVG